jgi:hypothetical protein
MPMLGQYWFGDDPMIINHALDNSGLGAFYDPKVWQQLSPSNLTPWVTLSFKIDLALFGLDPFGFYLHQLVSLLLLCVVLYILVRHWSPSYWACATVLLFLAGASTTHVARFLMTRHYLEGAIFAILAVLGFVHARRKEPYALRWQVFGLIFYLLAVTAKEIYVPLLIVLIFVPPRDKLVCRVRSLMPYALIALLYTLWRGYMLGSLVGGYGTTFSYISLIATLNSLFHAIMQFPAFLFGNNGYVLVPFLPVILYYLWRTPEERSLFLFALICSLAPLLPLTIFPGITGPDRYLFLPWLLWCLLTMRAVQKVFLSRNSKKRLLRFNLLRGSIATILFLSFAVPAAAQMRRINTALDSKLHEFSVQGRFMVNKLEENALFPSPAVQASMWYLTELCRMTREESDNCPQILMQGLPQERSVDQVYKYDAMKQDVVLMGSFNDNRIQSVLNCDHKRSLEVAIVQEGALVSWSFGPWTEGEYFLVSRNIGRIPMTHKGAIKSPFDVNDFVVLYRDSAGWSTCSDLLMLHDGVSIQWSRFN